jgi:hypothetical protein
MGSRLENDALPAMPFGLSLSKPSHEHHRQPFDRLRANGKQLDQ